MKPYLVRSTVRYVPYDHETETFKDIRIVMADSVADARTKCENWWENRSVEYSYSYHADSEVMETIE